MVIVGLADDEKSKILRGQRILVSKSVVDRMSRIIAKHSSCD